MPAPRWRGCASAQGHVTRPSPSPASPPTCSSSVVIPARPSAGTRMRRRWPTTPPIAAGGCAWPPAPRPHATSAATPSTCWSSRPGSPSPPGGPTTPPVTSLAPPPSSSGRPGSSSGPRTWRRSSGCSTRRGRCRRVRRPPRPPSPSPPGGRRERTLARAGTPSVLVGLAVEAGDALLVDEVFDQLMALALDAFDLDAAAALVVPRLDALAAVPVAAASGFAHYDAVHMACLLELAVGQLADARRYARAVAALPYFREQRHIALGRVIEVDALAGEFDAVVEAAAPFERDWYRSGQPVAGNLAVGAYAAATVFGMIGDPSARDRWIGITRGLVPSPDRFDGKHVIWRATFDALLALHLDDPVSACDTWRRAGAGHLQHGPDRPALGVVVRGRLGRGGRARRSPGCRRPVRAGVRLHPRQRHRRRHRRSRRRPARRSARRARRHRRPLRIGRLPLSTGANGDARPSDATSRTRQDRRRPR